jgi:hypothetical protein
MLDTQSLTYIGNFKEEKFNGVSFLKIIDKDNVYLPHFVEGSGIAWLLI